MRALSVQEILDEVRSAIKTADPSKLEPTKPIRDGEVVIGALDDEARRIFAVHANTLQTLAEIGVEHNKTHLTGKATRETCVAFYREIHALQKRADIFCALMWEKLYREIPKAAEAKSIALRKGWVVVETQSDIIADGAERLLRAIFGDDDDDETDVRTNVGAAV